jgi:hypothetical protein
MNCFKQRSSWPSSLLTGLIGWVGWIFIGPLIFGMPADFSMQCVIALAAASLQVAALRLLFFPLQMHRSLFIGILWGALSAIGLYAAAAEAYPVLKQAQLYWLLTFIYVGAPVGGFLSYFYEDDRKIHADQAGSLQANYGRDAHWLEPFGFGLVAYLAAFHPASPLQLVVNVMIAGALSGVAAAGASHFSPDKWKRSYALLGLLIVGIGSAQGALTGLLFRHYDQAIIGNYLLKGIIAGILTYLITFLRGRQLAYKEQNGLL